MNKMPKIPNIGNTKTKSMSVVLDVKPIVEL